MATAQSPFGITGSINEYSLYRMRGVDKVILRKKGGPRKADIKTAKNFINVRRQNAEFGAAAKSGADIRMAIRPVIHTAEPFFSGRMNALAGKICKLSDTGSWGERPILVSKYRHLLEGMNLNSKMIFNSIMRQSLPVEFDRDNGKAVLHLPALTTGLNFCVPSQYPLYQFTISLGVITDMGFGEKEHAPVSKKKYDTEQMSTDWYPSRSDRAAQDIELNLARFTTLAEGQTMIQAMAIDFGNPTVGGGAERIKYAGSGIVLAMG